MMRKRKFILPALLSAGMLFLSPMAVLAETITEAQVEAQVASQGKEAVTGNVFIWFLCAVAFLKISQKIDSFMATLGVNVGNTGGNMMAELLIAGRSLSGAFKDHGGGGQGRPASPGSSATQGGFLSGGLAGSVSRQTERSAVNSLTGQKDSGGFGNALYQSSLKKGGDFANQVIGDIAKGDYGKVGSIKGKDATQAFESYMGLNSQHNKGYANSSNKESSAYNAHQTVNPPGKGQEGKKPGTGQPGQKNTPPIPTYSNMEIGGGRISGTEKTKDGNREFAMYHADQYMKPSKGDFDTVKSVDGATWYKQYAQNAVEKSPYQNKDGKIAYNESIVQKLPPAPPRKGRV